MDRSGLEGGGSYLESMSDLLVGFLFIFMILIMTFALQLAQAQKRADAITKRLTNSGELRAAMLQQIQASLLERKIKVDVDPRNGIVRLPEDLLFDSGSSTLRPGAEEKLHIIATELMNVLPCYAGDGSLAGTCPIGSRPILDAMFIEGHTDSVPIANAGSYDNFTLSAERAKTTFLALTTDEPQLDHLHNPQGQSLLGMSAYGDKRPVASNATEAGRRKNRRIDLRFVVGTPRVEDAPK